ncbi:MAG: MBG domain-containing protein [Verrucomicrobiota bacterium]
MKINVFSSNLPRLINAIAFRFLILAIGLLMVGVQPLIAAEPNHDAATVRSVALVDSALLASIPREEFVGSRVIPIDGNRDVIEQITAALDGQTDIDVVRVLSHGEHGALCFGAQKIDAAMLDARSREISDWKNSLSANAQILIYGCSVAGTNQGKLLVDRLASLTHANVAASTNTTGTGGDTVLEYGVGEIRSGLLADLADYERAGVSLQLETSDSTLTSWTSNQNGTVTATMEFNLRGRYYYAGGVYSTAGDVYMYLNNKEVARKYINATRDPAKKYRVTFTATFAVPVGNNKISVSPRDGFTTSWGDYPVSLVIEAPYFYGAPAAARAHTVAVGNFFQYYYYAGGTDPQTSTATGLPAGLTINSIGVISGYPRSGTAGVHVANITVSNGFGSSRLPVTFTITNQAPDFASTSAATISGGVENTPLTISYATLAAAVGATDPNNTSTAIYSGWAIDPISFRIESILGGTLTKNGTPITAGTTSIAAGESLVWTPPASVNGVRDAFTIKAYDGALYSAATKTVKVSIGAINDAPTLTSFSGPVTAGTEDSSIPITFADLVAKGDEADIDSAVTGFVVKEVTTGSLKIGATEGTATPWDASTNKVITASFIGYWTPDPNVNGPQSALKLVARDDGPLESATPVQMVVAVSSVTDAPTLSTIDIISGQTEGEPMEITYTSIAAAADEADVDGDVISFRVEAISSGSLQKWSGSAWGAVVPGTTLIAVGDKVLWTPAVGTTGLQNALTIKAWDGQFASATGIQLKIDAARWTIVPWTAVATSGFDPKYRYTHAYSFGASGSFAIGGISFTGIAGGNPSVDGRLSTTNFGSFTANDDNNLSDASRSLANDFVYGSSAIQTVTLRGLIPGTRYVLSLFTVGADSTSRDFTLQGAMGQVAVNQNAYGNNNGIRIDYKYLADSSGSATITITPASGSFNLYGLANREAAPSATLYPPSSLTYDGSPKSFQSGIAARNEPFVSAGVLHSVVLKSDGTVSAFGTNNAVQTNVPAGLNNVVAVSAGGYHTLALKSDGTVVAWGSNYQGQSNIPSDLSGVVAISAGKVHNLALKSNGTVVAWGSNSGGQTTVPAGLTGIVAISAGASHSMALKSDGTVVAWGVGWYNYATPPADLTDVVAISAGEWHSLALKSDGTVVAWGNNGSSQTKVPAGLKGVVAISAGTTHSVAVKSDGTVVAWGDRDNYGITSIPAGLAEVVAIDAGSEHTITLKADGTVVSFGWFRYGQNSPPASEQFPSVGLAGRSYTFNAAYTYSYQGRGVTTYVASTTAPTSAGDYTVTAVGNGATITQNFTINKVTPSVGYINRVNSITYGTALNSNHVDSIVLQLSSSDIPGSKVYSPAIGAILPVGTHPLSVSFLPTDSVNFNPAVATGTIIVTKAAVSAENIALPSLTDLTFNGLSKIHAATAAGVSGFTYTYTGRPGTSYGPSTVAPTYAGSYTVTATINDANYSGTKSLDFAIAKATPTITSIPTASAISYGQSLTSSSLTSGTASVPGVFAFNTPSTTPSAGSSNHSVTFTPTDTANYNPVSSTVSITTNTVALNSSNIAFTVPVSLVYSGTAKTFTASASSISTGFTYSYSSVSGTSYGPTSTPPINAGNYAVTATVTNANYTGSATQTFTITKATPAITWAAPASIAYGTGLSATQHNASTSVAGNFAYTPATGTVLSAGARTLQAVFTPTDTANYNTPTASVSLQVTTTSLQIPLLAPPNLTYDGSAKSYIVSQNAYLSAGSNHALVLKADGTVVAWGRNNHGQSTVPAGLSGVVQVSAGYNHSVAVKSNGTIVGWGNNSYQQYTGYPVNLDKWPGEAIIYPRDLITNAKAAAAGGRMTVVLRANGTVTVLGSSIYTNTLNVPAGLTNVTAVAAGEHHAVALKADGAVVAWGSYPSQDYGQATVPAGLGGVMAITAGFTHTLALKSDGTVVAWGNNGQGQCTVPTDLSGVVAITAGFNTSYAIKADGTVVGWGYPYYKAVPTAVTGVAALAAGEQHAFAIKTDGMVVAWGQMSNNDGSDLNSSPALMPSPLSGVGNFNFSYSYGGRAGTTYAASSSAPTNAGNYTLTVTSTDPNYSASKSIDFTIAKSTPTLTSLPVAAIITEGQALSAATRSGGSSSVNGTFAFSSPSYVPEAGASTQSLTFTPTDLVNYNTVTTSITVYVQGANAATPTITLLPSASAITFGQQLGSSTLSGGGASVPGTFVFSSQFASPNPGPASQSVTFIPTDIANYKAVTFSVPVTVYDGIVSPLNIALVPPASLAYDGLPKPFRVSRSSLVSAGRWGHVLVVKSDGAVSATGDNSAGQTNVPAGLTGVVAVATGSSSSMALKSDGTVVEWGNLGTGSAPVGLTGVVAIARGTDHALALKSNGTVVAWGDNSAGQCNVPAGLLNVVGITGSNDTSYALKSDGTVVAWGAQPTIPDGLSGVIAIHASSDGGMVALKSDGTLVALGFEAPPSGLSDVVAVAAGRNHRVALKSDGTVVAWGSGTTFTPTGSNSNLVPWNVSDVAAIAAGDDRTYAIKTDGSVVWWGNGSGTGAHRVNGEVYRTPEGYGVSVPELKSILTASSAGFAFSATYTGREGTTYTSSSTPPTNPGNYSVKVTGTDPDFAATKMIDFSITKGRPIILSTPFPSGISYGETLASSPLLEGTASVPGTFAFENPSTIPNAGDSMHNLVFTPADTVHYEPVTVAMEVRVSKATPSLVALPTATTATHGQALAELTLANGLASVSGTFTFNSVATVSAGTTKQTVTFTPNDATNYNAVTTELDVTVAPATPSILTNPTATPIAAGQTLSSSTLSGGEASVGGSFTWENPNTAPDTGTTSQSFVFTPNDTVNYTTSTGTVSVSVDKATPTVITPPIASDITFGQSLAASILDGGVASVAGKFAWANPATEPNAGTVSYAFTFTPDDTTNYQSTTGLVSVTVNQAVATVTLGNLTATYDATAKAASVATTPEGLAVILSYNGEVTAPTNAGTYEVVATINDTNYTGTKSELLTIAPGRLFGIGGDPLGRTKSSVITLPGDPIIQGIACDGERIYVNSSSSEIRVYDLDGALLESHAVENLPPLGNNQMAFAGGYLFARNDDTLYRISTTDWSNTPVAINDSHPLLSCAWWMHGSLFDTPDGRIGTMGPTDNGQFTVRFYQVSSDGLTLTWEKDQVINDTWSTDEHGMACDGTFFYRMSKLEGCKVYDLATGNVVYDGAGWDLHTDASGTIIVNPTWLTRNHRTGQLIAGDYQADRLLIFTPDDGIDFTAPQSMIYDGDRKAFSASSTVPCTFANTYMGTGITSYGPSTEAPRDAGNYVVTARSTLGSSSASFAIAPKSLTITADAKTKRYGSVDPALTYQSSGLVGEDAITGNLVRSSGENVGTYAILRGTMTAGANYEISYTGADLVISPVPIAPTNFLAAQTTNRTADLSWTPNTSGNAACTGFKISHKPSASDTWTENTVASNVSTYSVSNLLPGTVYDFRIASLNGGDSSSVVTTTITTWTSREEWRFTNFGAISGSGNAADNASPSGDGMPNLMKYALGLSVTSRNVGDSLNTQMNADRRFTLTFTRARTELTYTVEGSNDLKSWSVLVVNPGSIGGSVTVTDESSASAPRRFLRLKVSD